MIDAILQDLRYALRTLGKARAFSVVAVLTLGLGIGANTAIFSVVNAVLLRPLPFDQADQLVFVRGELRARDVFNWPISPRILLDMRERATLIDSFAGIATASGTMVAGEGEPVQLQQGLVTPNLFGVLHVAPVRGRDFTDDDAAPIPDGTDPTNVPPSAAILSHRLWQTRFSGDPAIVGRTIEFNGNDVEVIGIMPAGFKLLLAPDAYASADVDVWLAPRLDLVNFDRRQAMFDVVGRLADGVTVAQAQSEMDALAEWEREINEASAGAGYGLRVVPMQREITANVQPVVLALLGAVGFVLLIACANVSNLLLVRASARDGEIAVRAALGGSRARLMRQFLTESVVLAALGAVVGLVVARLGINGLLALGPQDFPRLEGVGIDGVVLAVTATVSLAAALVFGSVPALQASRVHISDVLKDRGRSATLSGKSLFRNGIVVVEVAMSVVLLIGAGLMLRSFVALQRAEPGFVAQGALTFELQLVGAEYGRERRVAFVQELRQRLGGLPGVEVVSAGLRLPLQGAGQRGRYGTEAALEDDALYGQADYRIVQLDYFRAMGTRLLAGRAFEPEDFAGDGAKVVVVDELVAARLWPGESAVGKTLIIRRGPDPEPMRIIGVVEHERSESLSVDSKETVYFGARDYGDPRTMQWVVRTRGGDDASAALAEPVRAEIAAMDASLPVTGLRTMTDVADQAMAPTRFAMLLIGVFAGFALLLATVGLYSVLAHVVRQRTGEIGLRMALGARPGSILGLVVRQGLGPSLTGIGVGVLAALWLTRFMSRLLVDVAPTDAATFAGTAVLFLAIAVLASLLPAWRATRVDPVQALSSE